ncbi:MAG: hypothetical protein ACJ70Y_08070, partial [Nitrososphaera sp.]
VQVEKTPKFGLNGLQKTESLDQITLHMPVIKLESRGLKRKTSIEPIRYTPFTRHVGLVNRLFQKQVIPYFDRTLNRSYFIRLYEPQGSNSNFFRK